MALIKCPECGKEISDKASSCPNCGCPILVPNEKIVEVKTTEAKPATEKKAINMKIVITAFILVAIALIAVFVAKSISKKNAQAKREQQIQDVKTAMDNVDSSLAELIVAMEPDEPFLYGDSSSDAYKAKITEILDVITENQKIVEDAYKNEDREFIKELDDYISTNKKYRSWDEYNTEIKKLYGNSISNEQAADNVVKEMASSEEEYQLYLNHYFVIKHYDNGELLEFNINDCFDPESDFGKISDKAFGKVLDGHQGQYYYDVGQIWVEYLGDGNPKDFKATFKLLGTGGKVISEEEWDINKQPSGNLNQIYGTNGIKRIGYSEVKSKGFINSDHFDVGFIKFFSDVNDTPTGVVMEVTSGE